MRKFFVLVEGQTEEAFVNAMLAPHFLSVGLAPIPVLLRTKKTKDGTVFKGGITRYPKVRGDLLNLLRDSSAVVVTTMLDYYGLPYDFPGCDTCPKYDTPYKRVEHLQKAWAADIRNNRFVPFLTLHEFEALLFVDVEAIAKVLPDYPVLPGLKAVRAQVQSPEEINEGPTTHPSAHISRVAQGYQKTVDGPLIVQNIGLSKIRAECPHFHQWIARLESLAT